MSSSNSMALLERTSLNVYGADIFNCSRHKKDAKLALDELNALVVRELEKEGSIRMGGLGIFRKRKLAGPRWLQSRHW